MILKGDWELLLCRHHANKHKASLEDDGWYVIEDKEALQDL
jgi:hypothetical protein